jgi:hypothetical protein
MTHGCFLKPNNMTVKIIHIEKGGVIAVGPIVLHVVPTIQMTTVVMLRD